MSTASGSCVPLGCCKADVRLGQVYEVLWKLQSSISQSVVPGPAASVSPGNLLEMQFGGSPLGFAPQLSALLVVLMHAQLENPLF